MCPSSTPNPDLLKTFAAVPWSEHLQKSPRIRPRLKSVADEEGNQVRFIDMTGVDLRSLVHKAYELSCPVGNGHLDYEPGLSGIGHAKTTLRSSVSPTISASFGDPWTASSNRFPPTTTTLGGPYFVIRKKRSTSQPM